MLGINLNKKNTYLLSCTYNCESMCLLDILLKEGIKPIICYVNYKINEKNSANLEHLIDFCKKNDLILEVTDDCVENDSKDDDKRESARLFRYKFFKKVYDKYNAAGLFISHTQDELIEFYLLQSQGSESDDSYGWNKVSVQDGMVVYRPLLNYSTEDVLNYNEENKVEFISLTENDIKLIEHPIKVNVINKLTEIERENLLSQFKGKISDEKEFLNGLKTKIDKGGELDVRELIALNDNGFVETITDFIGVVDENVRITKTLLADIRKMCLNQEENMSIQLNDSLFITKEYDVLTIGGNLAKPLYSYELKKPGKLKTEYFELDFSNGAADRGFRLSDYPLTIRPAVPEDLFNVHGFMTPIRKLYYDWRMPPKKKVIWPVIANKYGEVIYIPRYHRLHRTDHTSKFEINFSEDN